MSSSWEEHPADGPFPSVAKLPAEGGKLQGHPDNTDISLHISPSMHFKIFFSMPLPAQYMIQGICYSILSTILGLRIFVTQQI